LKLSFVAAMKASVPALKSSLTLKSFELTARMR